MKNLQCLLFALLLYGFYDLNSQTNDFINMGVGISQTSMNRSKIVNSINQQELDKIQFSSKAKPISAHFAYYKAVPFAGKRTRMRFKLLNFGPKIYYGNSELQYDKIQNTNGVIFTNRVKTELSMVYSGVSILALPHLVATSSSWNRGFEFKGIIELDLLAKTLSHYSNPEFDNNNTLGISNRLGKPKLPVLWSRIRLGIGYYTSPTSLITLSYTKGINPSLNLMEAKNLRFDYLSIGISNKINH